MKIFYFLAVFFKTAFFVVVSASSMAQSLTGKVSGRITDGEDEPIPYVNVYLEDTQLGDATDLQGHFSITAIKPGEYMLQISALGYAGVKQRIEIEAGQELKLSYTIEETASSMPQITIIAEKDRLFSKVPGSVDYIERKELQLLKPISGNEVFRRMPGIHVVDEEGAGLRANIGIRGLNPDRSRNVLVLEDGIPVALNPYGEPEMYYTPAIDRMVGVEVLKGSGQILYGPQTIGGVINYITADPPSGEKLQLNLQGGQGGLFTGLVGYGKGNEQAGYQINYLRKQADELGPTRYRINDINGKFRFNFSEKSKLGVKVGAYDETSNSTYVGLTQAMYDQGGQDYVTLAPNDELDVRRFSLSFHHDYKLADNLHLSTVAFGYTTTRNWKRQDYSYDPTASRQTGLVWGDESIDGGAIYFRDGTGNRNRQFEVAGVSPRLTADFSLGSVETKLITGVRYLYERGYEQRVNGQNATAESGDLVQDEMRTGHALSAFAQHQLFFTEQFSANVGFRTETYRYERDIFRTRIDGMATDTSIVNNSDVNAFIPGLGFNFKPNDALNIFGGIHRGFAPPRIKDAITAVGEVVQLDAEKSWNIELGLRSMVSEGIFFEATGFLMDFDNQIIPVSESSGGTGAGLINAGRTIHRGVEAAVSFDYQELMGTAYNLILDVNATYVQAEYAADRFVDDMNVNGNRTPYAPKWLFSSALTYEAPKNLSVRLTGNYVGEQFTDELNTVEPSANGRTGRLPSYFVLDGTVQYQVSKWKTVFNLSVKNLTDARYISTRRPQGIRVGLPRFVTAGVSLKI